MGSCSLRYTMFVALTLTYFLAACKKEDAQEMFVPFLTDKLWKGDTILINSPLTYEQLSVEDQQSFRAGTLWFKNAQLTFNEDGTVTTGGDYDLGFKKWTLIHNGVDIEITLGDGNPLVLHGWIADAANFSYTSPFVATTITSFDCTFIYK